MANVLEKEWNSYFVQLNETEKKSVLQMLKIFLKRHPENEECISVEQYNEEIEAAMDEIEKGQVHSHEEVIKLSENW